ncbi:MAG TPA: xyloglucanase [Polyangiaceae bacterium]|nr:xyloglucanase [Polyangiaceae bacterium]
MVRPRLRVLAGALPAALLLFAAACGPTSRRSGSLDSSGAGGGVSSGGAVGTTGGRDVTSVTPPPIDDTTPAGPYRYRSVSILGGGFVTGIVFSAAARDLIYARTDIGGAYRWNVDHWSPLTDWVDRNNVNLLGIESIACDPSDPSVVYMAAGTYVTAGNGTILRSTDGGLTFNRYTIGVPMGGNNDGRSMGERLMVDPNLPTTVYFATRTQGLWRTKDSSVSWSRVGSFPVTGATNLGLSLVVFDPRSAKSGEATKTIYVGVADTVGSSLYRSTDAGESFQPVVGAPSGMMPHHAVIDGQGVVYLAYNDGPGPNNVSRGAVFRYDPVSSTFSDISPPTEAGIGGLAIDSSAENTLVATTLDQWPDELYRTSDAGKTWTALGPNSVRDAAGAQYLYFGGDNLSATGWMGDIEIDPFRPERALYVTGQGIWRTEDLTAADSGRPTHWTFENQGLEETVALDLLVPPDGAELLSGLGDIGGFRHDDLDLPAPAGMYTTPVFGNTTSLDFAELQPEMVVRVGTGGSRSRRGAFSSDGGSSWTAFASEPPSSRGQGSIAISADGETVLWAAQGALPSYSTDRGVTWTASAGLGSGARVAADRVSPKLFYALAANGTQLWVSRDGAQTFEEVASNLAGASGRPRAVFGSEGDVWLPTASGLLHSTDGGVTLEAIERVQSAYAVGFGMAAPDAAYPAIYLGGVIDNQLGVYRSDDAGQSFVRIDDAKHQYGALNLISGDPRIYGRVYLGTSGRGIVYGDPVP